jgi:hypothetical protein
MKIGLLFTSLGNNIRNLIIHPLLRKIIGWLFTLYGVFAAFRDELLPKDWAEKLRLGGIIGKIPWYWYIIIGLCILPFISNYFSKFGIKEDNKQILVPHNEQKRSWRNIIPIALPIIFIFLCLLINIPSIITPSKSTPTIIIQPTYTLTPTQYSSYTSTISPTYTPSFTPTNIYDPIVEKIKKYFDHIPNNNRPNTIVDYPAAWDILSADFQKNWSNMGEWRDYAIKPYYWNITPNDLFLPDAITILESFALINLKVEKIKIDGMIPQYNTVISLCMVKTSNGWKISHFPEKKLYNANLCIEQNQ